LAMGSTVSKSHENLYMWGVAAVGVYLLSANIPMVSSIRMAIELFFMGVLVVISEASPVPIPKGNATVSVSMPISCAITAIYGPEVGIWILALASLRKKDLKGEVPLRTVLFNRGMLTMSMYSFALAFKMAGGVYGDFGFPSGLPGFLAGSCAYTLTNMILAAIGLSLQTDMSIKSVIRVNMRWSLPSLMILFPVGAIMVMVVEQGGILLLAAFYIPLLASKISMEKYIELRDAYREMAAALSNAIDARDSYTRGHSERVGEYAGYIAKEMGMPEDKVDLIRYVGLLHDVGKVGIRDAIMKKPGTYTLEEYEEMKKHSEIGAQMVQGMNFIGKGGQWILHHHERWDGKGFPSGLKGEEIPLEARIMACADAFDAMTTDRPYKKRLSLEEAESELRRCSGTQFDPRVVEVMLKVIQKHRDEFIRTIG
jgi:putative nucleotidyltransferase with HDIG domain